MFKRCGQFWLIIFSLYVARVLYYVPGTPFTLQWLAESWYWVVFPIWTGILAYDTPAIPVSFLKEPHSQIKVVEFWMDRDADAPRKFVEHTKFENHAKYESEIVILRGIWANSTNELQKMNTFQMLRDWADPDVIHKPDYYYPNGERVQKEVKFSQYVDDMEKSDYPVTVSFDYQFLPAQDKIYNAYKSLVEEVGVSAAFMDHFFITFIFLFKGNIFRSSMHANYAPGYFLPMANSKAWRWINKFYMPYLGMHKGNLENGGLRYGEHMVWNEDLGVPYTDIMLNPGDLLYFGSWHPHQVVNMVPDALGFAIGIRHVGKEDLFGEPFWPLHVYNLVHAPRMFFSKTHRTKKKAFLYEGDKEQKLCKNMLTERPYTWAFNGTTMVRFDFVKENPDDELCVLKHLPEWNIAKWTPPLLDQVKVQ